MGYHSTSAAVRSSDCLVQTAPASRRLSAFLRHACEPTSGQAWIGDYDVWAQQVEVKRLIGVVGQRPNLDFSLTAREILLFHGAYFGIDSRTRSARATEMLDRFKLSDRADQLVPRVFRRHDATSLARARDDARSAKCSFSTSRSAGLDPQTRLLLWEIIREYNQPVARRFC